METVEVVVVGAGPSGLHVARGLTDAGRHVVVLEARRRVGGRLVSPQGFDLGPSWFWSNEPRVNALVEEFSLGCFPQWIAGDALFQNSQGVQRMEGNPLDAPSGRLVGGMETLATAMRDTLGDGVVKLGEQVTSIHAADDRLVVDSTGGSWRAEAVVVALPPATAVSSIDIGPALGPELRDLAAQLPVWMGQMVKVVASYPEPFWRSDGLAGSAFSHVGPMRELHDMSGPDGHPAALFGFAQPGPGAPCPTAEALRTQLGGLFGAAAASPTELLVQDWRTERFTSPPGVERLSRYEDFGHARFQQPTLGGRLHWSSTETSSVAPGHIEGALAAAERVVAVLAGGDPEARQRPDRP